MAGNNSMTPQDNKQSLPLENMQQYIDYLSKTRQANTWVDPPPKVAHSAPRSLLDMAVDQFDSVTNPIRTLSNLNKAAYGGLLAVLPDAVSKLNVATTPSQGLRVDGYPWGRGYGGAPNQSPSMPRSCITCHVPPSPPNTTQSTAPPASSPGIPVPAPVYDKSGLEVNPVAQSLKPPGNCNQWDYDRLKNSVDSLCKGDKRTCKGVSDPIQLQINRFANKDCAEARDNINNTCFAGGNLTHRDAAIDAWTAMKICEEKIK